MSAVAEMLARAQSLFGQAKDILLKPDATAEELAQAESLKKEAEGLKARASQLKEIEMAEAALPQPEGQPQPEAGKSGFKTWGDFVKAVTREYTSKGRERDSRLVEFYDLDELAKDATGRNGQKDMSGNVGASGGFLIPQQTYSELMAVAAPLSVVRSRATIIRMARRQVPMPVLDQTKAEAGKAAFFGGIDVFWQEEAAETDDSEPSFKQATLTAHELAGYTLVPNSLLADAETSLTDFLGGPLGFPGAIAWAEDYAFLRGSGVGKPQGVVDAPCTVATTRTTGGTVKYDDLVEMMSRHLGARPVWVANQALKKTLMLMAGPTATNYAGAYLWGNPAQGIPDTLLGYPILFTDKLPALGARGDIVLADFTYYMLGDRQAGTVDTSTEEKFRTNKTAFRIIHRVDGQPWMKAPITLADGSTTVSPFVVIAA